MKHKLTFLLTALLLLTGLSSWGQTRTQINWVAADQGYNNAQAIDSVAFDSNVSGIFDKGSNSNPPKYYTSGSAIRCYGGNYFTISIDSGNLTEIVLTFGSSDGSNAITTDVDTYANGTWTGSANSVTFTIGGTTGNRRIAAIDITYSTGGTSNPSIVAENVEIDYDATSGAIEYTVNNPVSGGVVTATTESDWLILGTVGSTVPFTCSVNPTAAERTASVTLTYTYNTDQTVTKNVTVTQEGNPNIVNNISDITETGTYTVQGTIVAKSTRGFVVGDGTGYVYYYNTSYSQSSYAIGDMVRLSGSVVTYGGVFEFNNTASVTAATTSNYVTENPTTITGAEMDARVASTTPTQLSNYVQYVGTLTVSGTYYNITDIEGATTAKGSISFPINTDFASLNGQEVVVKGYYVGISSSQYYNTMIGSVEENSTLEPTLTATPTQLEGFAYTFNAGPSQPNSFTINGSDLSSNVVVTAPQDYEITRNPNGVYSGSLEIAPTDGSVSATVYVRMKSGLSVGSHTGNISVTCDDLSQSVALSGTVSEQPMVEVPTFSPATGTYLVAQNVTISTTTEDATIYYTLDGTDPTESSAVYSEPIEVSTTTTIKAMATASGYANSAIATATYTINEPITIAEAHALSANEYGCVEGVVTFIDNRNVYVQDETAGIVLFLNANTVPSELAIGDMVRAYGKRAAFNGLIELSGINGGDADEFVILSSDNTLPLATKTIAAINDDYNDGNMLQSTRVRIQDAIIGAINTSGNTAIVQDGNSLNIYRIPVVEGLVEGDRVSVIGIVGCYNAPQLRVVNASDVHFAHRPTLFATPTSVSGMTYDYEDGGPSELASFELSGSLLTGPVHIYPSESFEVSTLGGDLFVPENPTSVYGPGDFSGLNVYVRMKANLLPGTYTEQIYGVSDDADTLFVSVSGTVTGEGPTPLTVETPTFTPAAGTYSEVQTVTIACATEGATIHYTLDGTDPTEESPVYEEALTISETTTIKAIAMKEGYDDSDIATATYTIQTEVVNIFNQDWEGEMNGWTFVNVEGEMSWSVATYQGNHYANANGYTGGSAHANVDWCISPAFNLGDYVNPVLTFRTATRYNGPALEVFFSNDYNGTDPTTATWTALTCTLSGGNFAWAESGDIDLSDFSGDNCYIGFKYTSTDEAAAAWEVDEIMLADQTTDPVVTVTLLTLTGFSYIEGNGPSAEQSFTVSGLNLSANIIVTEATNYAISLGSGDDFIAQSSLTLSLDNGTLEETTIYVRLKADLEVGEYNDEVVTVSCDDIDDIEVTCSGSVTEQPVLGGNYIRISDAGTLAAGNRVILAARYNDTENAYLAITNTLTGGKPATTEFISVMDGDDEIVSADILAEESSYYWTIGIDGDNFTFTNASGNVIGYGSNTNFNMNGDKTEWTVVSDTASATALVPEYEGFLIANVTTNNRAFAVRLYNDAFVCGAYSTSNLNNNNADEYNFFLDIFMQGEGGVPPTPVVATPTFTPAAGTYFEEQTVTIACTTQGATIHYTLDGTEPTEESPVYDEPLVISETTTIKAFAVKEGYDDSAIAEATYTIQLGFVTIFNQDWEDDWNGWTEVLVSGDSLWRIASYQGNHYALANGYNHPATEDWLISPAFNLDAYSNPMLSFRTATKFDGNVLEVLFSNDYDGEDPTEATWTALTCELSTGNYTWVESGDIDLSDFSGSECYIGFKYTCEESLAAAWEVDDIMLVGQTSEPVVTVTPLTLNGFTYIEGEGPSAEQSFTVSGLNLSANVIVTEATNYEISLDSGDDFIAQSSLTLSLDNGTLEETTIYVRLKADLEVGEYNDEVITVSCDDIDDIEVTCSGNVTEQPVLGDNYVRISDAGVLVAGNRVILAARYNETVDAYLAIANTLTSGKLATTEFTSEMDGDDEIIAAEILAEEDGFYWTVGITDNGYTFTNANGDMIGYGNSTSFTMNGDKTEWTIVSGVGDTTALVPEYEGFLIANVTTNNRAFAVRLYNDAFVCGAYSTSNLNNNNADEYNFFLDIFMQGEGGVPPTPTVAAPIFTPAAGTYYESQEVTISCATGGATIYYSLESENGPWVEYEGPITVDESMTIWAYAEMEGYNDSPVVSAEYVIQTGLTIIFNQDWEEDWHGWTEVSVLGDTTNWAIAEHSGNHYAYMNAFHQGVNEDWLISPAFDLTTYPDAVLTFVTARNYNGPDIEVFFSNDYDGEDPTTATWQPIECALSSGSWNWTESGEISLEDYEGSNCYIAFKYTSTEDAAAAWEVDDIMLVSGGAVPVPTLTATPNTINGLDYMEGEGPSESQSYTLTAANLEGEGTVTVTASEGFEISLNDEEYDMTLEIAFADGELDDQPVTIYVRLVEDLEAGSYEGTITHEGGNASTEVSVAGIVHSENEPYILDFMPLYIQGNNGSNTNRVPVATAVYLFNLEPSTTYRYTNQFVVSDDGPETAGAGNVIYANPEGFYRSTSPSLASEGNYGEFTTDEEGTGFVWFMNEPTANARFTPGNEVYLRIRINDGQDGTTVANTFTTENYATVLNFGTERDEYTGSAFYVKSDEAPMSFAMLLASEEDDRPLYSTSIETTGVDYGSINQYADFYKDLVAGNDGWFGGILPNDNEIGVNAIWILDIESNFINEYNVEDGQWYPEANTINPNNGLDEPIFIDLTYDGVDEAVEANVKVWSADHEFVIENGDDAHYTMTVYNVLGQSMMQKQINADSTQRISHNLTKGLYIISLQNNQNMVSIKVIVR